MTRIIDLADGYSSASAPSTTAVPTTANVVSFDNTGTNYDATNVQDALEELDMAINLYIRDQIDNSVGPLLDASVNPIPASASAPLLIVSSLAAAVRKIKQVDDIGAFINLYSDSGGTTLICQLGLGGGEFEVNLAAASSVYIRTAENVAINAGKITLQFLG
jgi:hypothetical protein